MGYNYSDVQEQQSNKSLSLCLVVVHFVECVAYCV